LKCGHRADVVKSPGKLTEAWVVSCLIYSTYVKSVVTHSHRNIAEVYKWRTINLSRAILRTPEVLDGNADG
jgi:hypothetical protein